MEEMATKYYTANGAAEYLGRSDTYVYNMISAGLLQASLQGKRWRIAQEALDAFWDTHIVPSNSTVAAPGGTESHETIETTEETIVNQEIEEAPSESQVAEVVPLESDVVEEVPAEVEEQAVSAPTILSKFSEAIERIGQAESRLMGLGVSLEHIDEILAAMRDYEQARESITGVRKKQFRSDARAMLCELNEGSSDVAQISLFLRRFAEHVVAHSLDISKEVSGIEDIVDLVPCMEQDEALAE